MARVTKIFEDGRFAVEVTPEGRIFLRARDMDGCLDQMELAREDLSTVQSLLLTVDLDLMGG